MLDWAFVKSRKTIWYILETYFDYKDTDQLKRMEGDILYLYNQNKTGLTLLKSDKSLEQSVTSNKEGNFRNDNWINSEDTKILNNFAPNKEA